MSAKNVRTTKPSKPARAAPGKPAGAKKAPSRTAAKPAAAVKPKTRKVATAAGKAPRVVARKPASTRNARLPAKPAAKPAKGKTASPAASAAISVGEMKYVVGDYGQLMSIEEYERMMGKKLQG